jgi:hypothetical protein
MPYNYPSLRSGASSDERGYWQIRCRQDTLAEWLKNDPILESGEFGFVIAGPPDQCLKIGDGFLKFSKLPWLMSSGDSQSSVSPATRADVIAAIEGQEIEPALLRFPAAPLASSGGQVIGVSADGQYFYQPDIVGGVPVVVNGKRYLLPLIEE